MMSYYMHLVGEKCYLSPLTTEDSPKLTEWLNDLDVTVPLGDEAYQPYGLEKMQADIAEALRQQRQVFAIVDRETDRAIGRCLLFSVDHLNRSAMLGIFIGDKAFWGRGYGQEAMQLLLEYAAA
jgi:RimJ/RimL family protein N-acetyltransferase